MSGFARPRVSRDGSPPSPGEAERRTNEASRMLPCSNQAVNKASPDAADTEMRSSRESTQTHTPSSFIKSASVDVSESKQTNPWTFHPHRPPPLFPPFVCRTFFNLLFLFHALSPPRIPPHTLTSGLLSYLHPTTPPDVFHVASAEPCTSHHFSTATHIAHRTRWPPSPPHLLPPG